jgi:trehalose 2-sulfotransferase
MKTSTSMSKTLEKISSGPLDHLFVSQNLNKERLEKDLLRPKSARNYIIYFTPRSGSSWLGDIIKSTSTMGNPGEWLNPNFIPNIANSINSSSLKSYFALLRRKQAVGKIFGMEVTYFQLNNIFPDNKRFFEVFNQRCPQFYLIREDIVSQAVSLSKAVSTEVYHSANTTDDVLKSVDAKYVYNDADIRRWLRHIREMEIQFEEFFKKFELDPVRMTYEKITLAGDYATVAAFGRELKLLTLPLVKKETEHKKIGTQLNEDFASRFREQNKALVDTLEAARAPMLELARVSSKKFLSDENVINKHIA